MKIILGIIQIAIVLIFSLHITLNWFSQLVLILAAIYLIVKGILFTFIRTYISALDALAGFYLLFVAVGIFSNNLLNIIVLLFVLQKGILYVLRSFH